MNNRLLGVYLAVVTTALALYLGFRYPDMTALSPIDRDGLSHLLFLLYCLGAVGGVVGLLRLGALGQKTLVRAVAFVPIIGFVSEIISRLIWFTDGPRSAVMLLTNISGMLILVGMMSVSIFVLAARTWTGWQRFAPLLTVLSIPAGLGIATAGIPVLPPLVIYFPWILVGFVIATYDTSSVLSPRPAM